MPLTTYSPRGISAMVTATVLVVLSLFVSSCVPKSIQEDDEPFLTKPKYTHYEDLVKVFYGYEKTAPDLAKVHSIGKSVEGRELLVLQITEGVSKQHARPAFKYVANMHGDEAVGRQLVVFLGQYLLGNYGKNDRVTKLVNTTDIYLMPSLNPDGFEASEEGNCESLTGLRGRSNAKGIDLNRDFPDQFDKEVSADDNYMYGQRQPETQAMVRWLLGKQFVLSGNLHGGAVVASYPYDDADTTAECCIESRSPDDAVFRHLAHSYADNHKEMRKGDACLPEKFEKGITNGAFWYNVKGGMQDFNYLHSNSFEVTFELSCCKFPPSSRLPHFWETNKESLLAFMEQAHMGVAGVVTDDDEMPIKNAKVVVEGVKHVVRSCELGDYYRLLLPGTYNVSVSADGFADAPARQVILPVDQPSAVPVNFQLQRHKRSSNDAEFTHHSYLMMESLLKELSSQYPEITRLYSIGKSVEGRELYVLEVTEKPGKHIPGKPEFKYVANMHGNEVVGRELLLLLARQLCSQYAAGDARTKKILSGVRVHLMPTMNPDGYERSVVGDFSSSDGRSNAHGVDLNRNFPDQFGTTSDNKIPEPETKAVMEWSSSIPFVLSANLHGGALVANYPYDGSPSGAEREFTAPDNPVFMHLAHTYSDAHLKMHLGQPCKNVPNERFPEGITNGAKWYVLNGGMQDWNYLYTNDMELTLELGCFKFPPASDLATYWQDNQEALIKYIEETDRGIKGFVSSHIGHRIAGATVSVGGVGHSVVSAKDGDYWRLLLPGTYNVTASKDGYESETEQVTVTGAGATSLNFTLMPDDPLHWSSAYDFRVLENILNTKYHTASATYQRLSELENKYPDIAEFQSGDSMDTMKLHRLEITDAAGSPEETKFRIAIISNLYASQPIGQEMLINFARHVTEAYSIGEPIHRQLLKTTVLHLIPNLDPLSDKILKQYNGTQLCDIDSLEEEFGDSLYHYLTNKDLNPLSNYTREKAFVSIIEKQKYDLILDLSSGTEDLIYPELSKNIYERFAQTYQENRQTADKYICNAENANVVHGNLIDLICERYNTPVISVGLSCCKMPKESDIGWVWRNNVRGIMQFVELTNTGITGYIKNSFGEPMRQASLAVTGLERQYRVSPNMAFYKMMLPPGDYKIVVRCHNYEDQILNWRVEAGKLKKKDIVLTRVNADRIPGGQFEVLVDSDPNLVHVTGIVLDVNSLPLRATVTARPLPSAVTLAHNATDTAGRFSLALPVTYMGREIVLAVASDGYIAQGRHVVIDSKESVTPNILFKLERDDKVIGMPRLVFFMVSGVVGVALVSLAAWCFSCRAQTRESRREYLFTQIPSDDKRPLCEPENYEIVRKPYYDDEDIPPSDTDTEEEIVLLRSDREWRSGQE